MAEQILQLFQNQRVQVCNFIKDEIGSLNNKKIIITGANSGLGFHLCQIALYKGASIVMACRNENKVQKAKEELLKDYPSAEIDILLYDQSSLSSCRQLAKDIIDKHSDFYCLILNAGVFLPDKKEKTKDGFPLTTGINFFAVIAILTALEPFLSKVQEEKRIIFQSSLAAFLSKYRNFEKNLLNQNLGTIKQYNYSKLALSNYHHYLYENNANTNIKYLLAEPGICETPIVRKLPKFLAWLAHNIFYRPFCHSSVSGSLSSAYLLTVEDGNYYRPSNMFGSKGLPKKSIFKNKYIKKDLIIKALEIVRNK